jgi:hypothetical protein
LRTHAGASAVAVERLAGDALNTHERYANECASTDCLAALCARMRNERRTALAAATESLDLAFTRLSTSFAEQVEAP